MASNLGILKTGAANLSVPAHFRCPISLDLMKDPVTLSTGITYDRHSIETWLDHNRTCPVTNQLLSGFSDHTPNHTIRRMIQAWCVANRSHGIERIPTPRAPITPIQLSEILDKVELASSRHDRVQFLDLVEKIKNLAKESERNRRCISSNGSARVIAASFREFTSDGGRVCSEIMSVLTCMFPLGDDTCRQFETPEALRSVVSILRSGDLAGRLNAVMVVKEIAADKRRAAALAEIEGLVESIARMIKEPISPRATKTSLVAAYYLVSASELAVAKFVDSGLVSLLLEIIVESDKGVCEKALGVLDGILGNKKAREEACDHALTIPVLVKKMFRVSDIGTGFAVSGIWKILKKCEDERRRMVLGEGALSVGAFQKLLLLLQVGCSEGTKEKVSQLLRMLNGCTRNGECFDSMDFRGIKRNI